MLDQDKGLVEFLGKPMVSYALNALSSVAETVMISANRNIGEYLKFGYRVVPDAPPGFQGPLAGILTGMRYASTQYLLVLPCDVPLLEGIHLAHIIATFSEREADVCVPHDGERLHPAIMMVRTELAEDLTSYLESGERKLQSWLKRHRWAVADFSGLRDKLHNVNTVDELNTASSVR